MSRRFRVLSLAGGGMRGVFSAAVLCELEDSLRHQTGSPDAKLADYFDLIVGTSTGGLLALGLVFEKSPEELLHTFMTTGHRIFPPWWQNASWLRLGPTLFPHYSQQRLLDVIQEIVPADRRLGQATRNLVLTAMRRETGEVTCLKSHTRGPLYRDHAMSAAEAALATAAAPIAFRFARTAKHGDLLDGGLWANTPVMVGIIESLKFIGQNLADIDVLSIGTTSALIPRRRWWHLGGVLEYGGPLTGRLMNMVWRGQDHLALKSAEHLLQDGAFHHIDHVFEGGGYKLNDSRAATLRALEQAGRTAAQKASPQVGDRFFTSPARRP